MPVIAIDQGTTSTKAAVLDDQGGFRISAQLPHDQIYPQEGWVEHDPEALLGNVRACLEQTAKDTSLDAIGIDNQGETIIAWDAQTGRPVYNAIVWQDNRTWRKIEEIKASGAEQLTLERAKLPLDPYFSASKIAWVLQEVPEAKKLLAEGRLRAATTDAYFLDRLCGKYVTDVTTASRTSLFNLEKQQWDADLCELFGVPMDILPEIRPTSGALGEITVGGKAIPVTASVVDQQAALYGHGCRVKGDMKITFGTGAFLLTLTGGTFPANPGSGLLTTIAWQVSGQPAFYALDGGVYNAGSAVNWVRQLGLFSSYEEINQFDAPAAIARGIAFVPALSGLACPHWDRSAKGLWIGMTLDTTRQDLAQAALEGIGLRTAQVADVVEKAVPLSEVVSIDGGLANNPYFCQFLATVLRRQVKVPEMAELTLLGAAQLARGWLTSDPLPATNLASRTVDPLKADTAAWRDRFAEATRRAGGWSV